MAKPYLHDHEFIEGLLDIIPALILIMDDDMNILDANSTVTDFLKVEKQSILHTRGGEVFNCINHTDVPEGCGRGPECKDCIFRNSVKEAVAGKKVLRKQMIFKYLQDYEEKHIYIMITAAPFNYLGDHLVLLILEDISEIIKLKKLIPICASCKKIRDDKNYWNEVEEYFSEVADVDFSHGICPDCFKKLYPEFYKKKYGE